MAPILGIYASQITGHLVPPPAAGSYDSISTVTVTSGSPTTVTFSSIPSTYKHLQIRATAMKGTTLDWVNMTLNSDTGNNYPSHRLYGNGTAANASGNAAQGSSLTMIANSSSTIPAAGVIDFLDYANTSKYKTIRSLTGFDNAGSGEIYITSASWMSLSAINSITFSCLSGSGFVNNTKFALYGIKG